MTTQMNFAKQHSFLPALATLTFFLFLTLSPVTAPAQKIVTDPEVLPEYPGGMNAMLTFLGNNISYPEAARKSKAEGTSVVSFVIEKNGQVSNVEIKKGFNNHCDAEAVRVVKAMPDWKPGESKGKKVRTQYVLPVKFKLD